MILIASRQGFLVAFLSLAAGVGGLFAASALGATSKAPAIGFLALGAVAWAMGRHEPERGRACSLFFIPLRLYAVVGLAIGALFFFVPDRSTSTSTAAASPEDRKLKDIESKLRTDDVSGSSGMAQEKAVAYRQAIMGFEKLAAIDGSVHVHLDLDSPDLKAVKKASLYIQSFNLKKYDDAARRALIGVCVKMLRADFPDATLNVAARGLLLWGVRGTSATGAAAPVILIDSTAPRF